jgi:hypothetical protein
MAYNRPRVALPWWEAEKGHVHEYLQSYIDTILQQNNLRFQDYVRFAGLYGNWNAVPLIGSFLATGIPYSGAFRRVAFNMTQSMVDTVTNQRSSEYGRLQVTSVDGDYEQYMIAKMATMALRNEFESQDIEYKFYGVVRDALLFGRGLGTVDKIDGLGTGKPARPMARRQFAPEVVVDPFENCVDSWPFSFDLSRYVSRVSLERKYPQYADKIVSAISDPASYLRVRGDDNVRVDEAWTPLRDGKPGRHVVCISGATLLDEEYHYEEPPFVSMAWNPPEMGWYGRGLVDQLMGLQQEVNTLLEIIHEAHKFFAHPFMLVEQNSNFNPKHVQNVPARILTYQHNNEGSRPQIISSQMIAPEVYQHLERCYQKAYEIAGINPYVAQAKTMQRLESSKAQRSMQDMNDQRHFFFARQCEEMVEKWAKLWVRVAAECDEENGYATRMPVSAYFPKFHWSKVRSALDNFEVKMGTVNPLMGKTSEDLQEIQEAMQMAQLTPTQFRQYLDNPDVQRNARLVSASDDYIDWAIHYMTVDPGEALQPNQYADNKAAIVACIQHYLVGERLGWPSKAPKAPENLLNYIEGCKQALMADQLEQAQAGAGMPPGATPAQPGTPQPPVPNQMAGMQAPDINIQNVSSGSGSPAPQQGIQ